MIFGRQPAWYFAFVLTCSGAPLHAQGAWDAILNIDPYPSPYYSDWNANPNISVLTVINRTSSAERVRIHFSVLNRANKVMLSGSSDWQAIGAGSTVVFDSPYKVAGSTTHNSEAEKVAARTGRLPEGEYNACAAVADGSGFVLAESCVTFTIVYPDPPLLLGPDNGDDLSQPAPLFLWTPTQVPIDYQLTYVLRVVEVFPGQTPVEALRSNIPHYQNVDGQFPSLRYPVDGRPFETGKQYAWAVQVLDHNGYAATSNDGRSEIWTFRYSDATTPEPRGPSAVTLSFRNDDAPATAADTAGLGTICRQWDANATTIVFPVTGRFFPAVLTAENAILWRDTASSRRNWAVVGTAGSHIIMLAGDCGIRGNQSVPRWAGIRTVGDSQELAAWVAGDTAATAADSASHKLKFGVVAISLFEQDVGGDDAFGPVRTFLEGHEMTFKPGLNLVGVLDARQWPKLWDLLSHFHNDDEHELTLQGFAGLNTTYAARLGVGAETGVEGSRTREFLTLSGTFPEKKIDSQHIASVQFGMEITYGDSTATGIGFDRGRGRDLVIKPLIVSVVTKDNVTWAGSLEVTVAMGTDHWLVGLPTGDVKWTFRLTTDHEWQPGPLAGSAIALGHPQLYLDINKGVLNALKQGSAGQVDWDVNARGAVIWHGEEVATGSLTIGRKADDPKPFWEAQSKRSTEQLGHMNRLVDDLFGMYEAALVRGDTSSARQHHQRYLEARQERDQDRKAAALDSAMVKRYERNPVPARTDDRYRNRLFWQFSLQLGNMSLTNLFDLVANVAAARRGGTP